MIGCWKVNGTQFLKQDSLLKYSILGKQQATFVTFQNI